MHEAFTYQIIQDKPPLEVTSLCSYGKIVVFYYIKK